MSQNTLSGKRSKSGKKQRKTLSVEGLETRDLLTGDVIAGGTLGLRADIDGSGTVDFADFLTLSQTFGVEDLPATNGDINLDGSVDFHDFHILSTNFGATTDIPTAKVQVIHNSPFAAAATVDVYLDGGLLGPLDDFSFRSATPFVEVPAGVEVTIDIAAPDSNAGDDPVAPIFSKTVTLEADTNYIVAAAGDPTLTEGETAFDLFVSDQGQEAAATAGNTEFLVFHGSPDAPTVDVVARDVGILVDDLSYPEFDDEYQSVPPANYTIDVTLGSDNSVVAASFEADLSGAADASLVVAASGFLTPTDESDPGFGLLAVFPDGTTALLPAAEPEVPEANLQIIHNSPYAAAAVVDIYVNDERLLNDVNFRDATGFLPVPAEVALDVDITAGDAMDNSSPVFSTSVTLEDDKNYIAIAAGDPTVSEGDSAFGVFVTDQGRMAAAEAGSVELLVFHGSPDAPTVDVIARDVATLVDDISFPEFDDGYVPVPPGTYTVDIALGNDNSVVAGSFTADLTGAADAALVVAASGFLTPSGESDPGFGLLAVFPNGDTALLPVAVDAAFAA